MKMRTLMILALVSVSMGCIGPGPTEATSLEDLRPSEEERAAHPDRVFASDQYWPELPLDAVARVKPAMTPEEVEALLGEPAHERGAVLGDEAPSPFDGLIQIYRYNDARLTDFPMTRDLVVAYAPGDDGWVVVKTRLF